MVTMWSLLYYLHATDKETEMGETPDRALCGGLGFEAGLSDFRTLLMGTLTPTTRAVVLDQNATHDLLF